MLLSLLDLRDDKCMKQLPRWIDEEPEEIKELLRELHWLRHRTVYGLRNPNVAVPQLLAIAQSFRPAFVSQGRYQLVLRFLTDCVMPALPSPHREAMPLYFGFYDDRTKSGPRREEVGMKFFHQAWWPFRREDTGMERVFLVHVANTLHRLPQQREGVVASEAPFIERDKLREQFLGLVQDRTPVIVLSGEPGVGKSRLADELTKQCPRRIWIEATSDQILMGEIVDALMKEGKDIGGVEAALFRRFKDLLVSPEAPDYLIIDNLEDSGLLSRLVPEQTQTRVVVTARRELSAVSARAHIEVGDLGPSEAKDMVCSLLPQTASPEAASLLAERVGRRPLAIRAACGLLRGNEDLSIAELSKSLLRHAAPIFDGKKDNNDYPSLTAIYRDTLTLLGQENPHARPILELMAYLHNVKIPIDLLAISLSRALSIPPESYQIGMALTLRAVDVLRKRYLVRHEDDGLSIHRLTQAILYGLIVEWPRRAEAIRNVIRESALIYLRARRHELAGLTIEEFLHSQSDITKHLWHVETTPAGADLEEAIKAAAKTFRSALEIARPGIRADLHFIPIHDRIGEDEERS